jgi:hypothetical protein
LMATRRPACFSDSFRRSSDLRSFVGFVALDCFFSSLLVVGAAAALATGSITFTSAAAAQIVRKGFGGRSVASRPLAGGTAK